MITKDLWENQYLLACDSGECHLKVFAGRLTSGDGGRQYPVSRIKTQAIVKGWFFTEDGKHYCPDHFAPTRGVRFERIGLR